jgi:hypothetical protein
MKLRALALASILLIGAGSNFPTEEEQRVLSRPYSECMRAAAERIDDGQSDIAVIGKAVAAACKAEFAHLVVALGQKLSAEDRQTLAASLSNMQIGYATVAVGQVRAMRRGQIKG